MVVLVVAGFVVVVVAVEPMIPTSSKGERGGATKDSVLDREEEDPRGVVSRRKSGRSISGCSSKTVSAAAAAEAEGCAHQKLLVVLFLIVRSRSWDFEVDSDVLYL